MTDHTLTTRTEWSRSHSGQDVIASCSCGWGPFKFGGSHQNHALRAAEAHAEHVRSVNPDQGGQQWGPTPLPSPERP